MLGRIVVDEGESFATSRASRMPPRLEPRTAWVKADPQRAHMFPVRREGVPGRAGNIRARGHEKGGGIIAMFRLDQEIERRQPPIRGVIGKHNRFARARGCSGIDHIGHDRLAATTQGEPGPTTFAYLAMVSVP